MLKVSSRLFPLGFIISVDTPNFNPHDFYIDGNWERIKGRVIVGVDTSQTEFNATGKTGGAKTHTLTIAQMPNHRHGLAYNRNNTVGVASYPHLTGGYGEQGTDNNHGFHTIASTGGGQAHNNLQPYQTAYMWKLVSYSN